VFDNPNKVFDDAILCPETQDPAAFADGILFIAEAQTRIAQRYFEDGSVELACPPLKALLHIMAHGHWEGLTVHDPAIRSMFTLEAMLQSEWYQQRLQLRQEREQTLWQRHVQSLDTFLNSSEYSEEKEHLDIVGRLDFARQMLAKVSTAEYLTELSGTLGADRL
ncbi:MAG: hypothetical protein ACKPJD_35690, partial [Planctomycetaceae bacterium]